MGIRGRLQIFAVVVAVPLAIVGAIALLGFWDVSRAQLKDSVTQQAELAAIAFDRWVKAQQEPLSSIATGLKRETADASLSGDLIGTLRIRPNWIDVRIVDSSGKTLLAEPRGVEPPPTALTNYLIEQTKNRNFWMANDRTSALAQPVIAIAVPTDFGGAVIARIRSLAINELFRNIHFNDLSVIAVFDPEGRILFRRQTIETPIDREVSDSSIFAAAGKDQAALIEIESPYDGIRRIYGVRSAAMNSVVIVGIPSAVLYEPARRRFMTYLFFSVATLGCAIIAGILISRSITRPIRQLQETTHAFAANPTTARATVKGGELGELAHAFNNMADQIVEREEKLKELDRLKSEFVGNVSHELRTPLTTIKTLTHVLQRQINGNERTREHLETIAAECDRQIDFVSNLLDLSRIESGAYEVELEPVEPGEVMLSCAKLQELSAKARGQTIVTKLPKDPLVILANKTVLRRVLYTLVENSIKYTSDHGEIILGVTCAGLEVGLYVKDNGSGIRKEDLPHVFERFYRGGMASTAAEQHDSEVGSPADQPGVGLGLYLAQGLVTQLRGRMTVKSEVGRGSTFTIYLPVWSDDGNVKREEERRHVETVTGG